MQASLSGKTYGITGFTSGIGLASAEVLAAAGAHLIGVGRSPQRCRAVEQRINERYPGRLRWVTADLGNQTEVRRAAAEMGQMLAEQQRPHLDGMVHVAGVFEYWMRLSPDGVETQWAVNHLAPFLLTHELMPWLAANGGARVVTVSSDSHYFGRMNWRDPQRVRGYNGLAAYGTTKLANVLFSAEFNRRVAAASGVRAFAVDPGLVKTDIGFKHIPPLLQWIWRVRRRGGTSAWVPARCIEYLLAAPEGELPARVYWKDSRPKAESRRAQDVGDARRLWEYSEQLCGIEKGEWE